MSGQEQGVLPTPLVTVDPFLLKMLYISRTYLAIVIFALVVHVLVRNVTSHRVTNPMITEIRGENTAHVADDDGHIDGNDI